MANPHEADIFEFGKLRPRKPGKKKTRRRSIQTSQNQAVAALFPELRMMLAKGRILEKIGGTTSTLPKSSGAITIGENRTATALMVEKATATTFMDEEMTGTAFIGDHF